MHGHLLWGASGTLVDEALPAGSHQAVWDGRGDNSVAMSSGIYYCRLSAGRGAVERKMVLLR